MTSILHGCIQMTKSEVYQNFNIQLIDSYTVKFEASGFDKSILLMPRKVHGKYVLHNLVTGFGSFAYKSS